MFGIKFNGEVYSWGSNDWGQLGLNSFAAQQKPKLIKTLKGIKQVCTGSLFSTVLDSSGRVWAFGDIFNEEEEILEKGYWGETDFKPQKVPKVLTGIPPVKQLAAVTGHVLMLLENGEVLGWGSTRYGQLGDGTHSNRFEPIKIGGLHDIRQVACGARFGLVLTEKGKVLGFGDNNFHQLSELYNIEFNKPCIIPHLPRIAKIACGENHCLAISGRGKVLGWGRNFDEELGTETEGVKNNFEVKRLKLRSNLAEIPFLNIGETILGYRDLELIQKDFLSSQIHL